MDDMSKKVNPPDYVFLVLVGILLVFGLIVLASASAVFSYERFGSSFYLTKHQLWFGVLPGLLLGFIALRIPYTFWRKIAPLLYMATLLLLLLVIIPGVGSKFGGARSWFTVGSLSFQPSEIAKLTLVLYLAAWFEKRGDNLFDFRGAFVPFTVIVGIVALFVVLQPDVGTLSIIGAIALAVGFIGGLHWRHLTGAVVAGFGLLVLLIKVAPYRAARLTSFINPELDPQGIGYHINQALLAVGSGGWFGVGFGHSRQKFRYLPEVTGDSIFPILAEEMGFFVSAAFLILTVAILWRMFRIAGGTPDTFSKLTVLGIGAWFGIQSFVNIGSMLGILPLTGLPLPFVSYGGTALLSGLVAVGIVGSISRHAK